MPKTTIKDIVKTLNEGDDLTDDQIKSFDDSLLDSNVSQEDKLIINNIARRIADKEYVRIEKTDDVPKTDGDVIYLNYSDLDMGCATAAHEGAHIRFGTNFNSEITSYISRRYRTLAEYLLNLCEDYRVNELNKEVFPGFVRRIRSYEAFFLTKNKKMGSGQFHNTLVELGRFLELGKADTTNTFPIWEDAKKVKNIITKFLSFEASVIGAKSLLTILSKYIPEGKEPRVPKCATKSSSKKDTGKMRKTKRIVENYEEGVKGDTKKLMHALKALEKERKKMEKKITEIKDTPPPKEADYRKNSIKLSMDKIEDGDPSKYREIVNKNYHTIQRLKNEFRKIRMEKTSRRGGRRGRLSLRDVMRMKSSRGAYDRIFKKEQDDYGANIMFLIDESGSTIGKCIKTEREVTISLAEALKDTRINFSVIGFGAKHARNEIAERVYKSFTETNKEAKLGSINTNKDNYENRDGTSLEYALRHFSHTNKKNKIMIILSDGMPFHGGTEYTGTDASSSTRDSIRRIRNYGIQVHGIGIGVGSRAYEEMYDNKNVVRISLHDLESNLINLVSNIADEVAEQKRR